MDAAIKEKIRKLEYTLKNFGDTLKEWEGAPELYSLTLREVERRRNKLSELKNLLQEIKVKASSENEGASLTKEREKLFADGSNEGNSKKFTAAETIANQKIALKSKKKGGWGRMIFFCFSWKKELIIRFFIIFGYIIMEKI